MAPTGPIRTLAVRLPNPLGDAVMSLPLLTLLERAGIGEQRVLLGAEALRPLAESGAAGWGFAPVGRRGHGRVRREAVALRATGADAVILLPNSWSSALAAVLAGTPHRIGRRGRGRGAALTASLPPISGPAPMTRLYAEFAALLGVEVPDALPPARLRADPAATPAVLRDGSAWLAVAPGAAFGPSKVPPDGFFAAVVRGAYEEAGLRPFLLGAPAESQRLSELAAMLESALDEVAVPVVTAGLDAAMAALAASRVLLSTDNGARHLAAALGVPQVVLYGPTHLAWSDHARERTVRLRVEGLDCLACHRRRCPIADHPCMTRLEPERAVAALAALETGPEDWVVSQEV